MPRSDIRLPDDEVRAFLAAHRVGVLVTNDGAHPDGGLVHLALAGEELELSASAAAVEAVGRDPRVCVVVEEQPTYDGIRAVLVHGVARVVGDRRLSVPLDDVVSFDFGRIRY